jgi:hypothetical protein
LGPRWPSVGRPDEHLHARTLGFAGDGFDRGFGPMHARVQVWFLERVLDSTLVMADHRGHVVNRNCAARGTRHV